VEEVVGFFAGEEAARTGEGLWAEEAPHGVLTSSGD
jgi:hypothetical protein